MLCNKCKKNEAAFYYKTNINGKVTETALCADCASKLHVDKKLFDDVFSINPFASLLGESKQIRSDTKRCPLCGSTFEDLAMEGKVGCAKCYETFARELESTISQLHGNAVHCGRGPKGFSEKRDREEKIASLKAGLKKAIDEQKFEDAAKLRDEIKELEAPAAQTAIAQAATGESDENKTENTAPVNEGSREQASGSAPNNA